MTRLLVNTAVFSVLAVLLGGCQVGGSPVSEREGYFTWVDEQGRVRYSPIVDSPEQEVATNAGGEETPLTQGPAPAETEGAEVSRTMAEETEYTLENYPDASQLEKDGYVRPGQRQPYFTWRDAEGNVRVSYYRPDTRTEAEKSMAPPPVELTPASIYHDSPDRESDQPVSSGDPDAFAVLGIEAEDGDYFSRFSDSCCLTLNTGSHEEWQQGREFGVRVTDQLPTHRFSTGDSPYQLIALASVDNRSDFIMQLRSYAHDGVFVPSLAFLNVDLEPVRLVTDLVSRYEPETWSRRGFLEAWVPVFPGQGERWIVIFTRDADLAGQTVIETRRGPKAIPHVSHGEIGLELVEQY